MLQAYKNKPVELINPDKWNESQDVIVKREKIETFFNDKGEEVKKRTYKEVNLSKKIKETTKVIKADIAKQKLAEIEKIFSK